MYYYIDRSGKLLVESLGLPELKAEWFVFKRDDVASICSFINSNLDLNRCAFLNHRSYKVMNRKLMEYQGAFGLCGIPIHKDKKIISECNGFVFNDIALTNALNEKDLQEFIYKSFYTDFGFLSKTYYLDTNFIINKILKKEYRSLDVVEILSIFIEYDDLYRGIVTIFFNESEFISSMKQQKELLDQYSPLSIKDLKVLNRNYGCRIAGLPKPFQI